MRALVLGGTGMLGRAVTAHARREGHAVLALGRERCDVTDHDAVAGWARAFGPDVLVNCAAYTKVDDCETNEELATRVNGEAVGHLAAVAADHSALLVQVSTDYVFSGDGVFAGDVASGDSGEREPIPVDAPTGPRSAYGRSKLRGEEEALAYERSLVVRTSWLFGPGGPNFVATIRRLLLSGTNPLRVVADQVGRPTYTPFLARALVDLARLGAGDSKPPGIVHYGNHAPTSWHGFAAEIARGLGPGLPPGAEVLPVTTEEFPRPAPRPAWSVLDVSSFERAIGRAVEPWSGGLTDYLERLGDSFGESPS